MRAVPDRIPDSEDLRAYVTKPLLDRITDQSIDSDYRAAAERREPTDEPMTRRRRPGLRAMIVVGLFALLATTAAVQTSRNEDVRQTSRQVLIDRIEQRQDRIADLHQEIAELREDNQSREAALNALGSRAESASSKAAATAEETGFAPVTGEGIRITIDNAPDGVEGGTVRDYDLAVIVNGLWQAGATAVSVDGQRVTPRSGVITSGATLRMNDVSLSPPYEVSAIGDTRTLAARFAETVSGAMIHATTQDYGMPYQVENIDRLTLPAAPAALLELTHLGANERDEGAKGSAKPDEKPSKKPSKNTDEDKQENTEGDREE
ncbi:membrane protein [Nocardioides luteus]|nr:membrane protein [Nocardioides luteus]